MLKFSKLSTQIILLLLLIALASSIGLSQATSEDDFLNTNVDISDDDELYEQRRIYQLNKLRHFLLTSNAEERAAKREKQNFYKRELIQEYLRSVNDPTRLQEVKKRIKTFCNSYEDVVNSDRAACG